MQIFSSKAEDSEFLNNRPLYVYKGTECQVIFFIKHISATRFQYMIALHVLLLTINHVKLFEKPPTENNTGWK